MSSTSKQFYSPNDMVKKLSQLAKDVYLTCSQLLCSSHASRVNFPHINALQWSLSKMGTVSNLTRFGASARVDFVTYLTWSDQTLGRWDTIDAKCVYFHAIETSMTRAGPS